MSTDLQVIPPNSLESITRGEIDMQIATAHRYPRSMQQFKKRALEMATLDEETAASCIYSRPVGGGKFAEGMSIRMAEIVGASYGNLRVGAMIISQTERQVVARGFAHDLESNFASTSEVVEATIKRDGTPYDERMRVVIAKACLAKARRDATFQVVPKALCRPVETEARRVAIGDATTIAKRRANVVTWIERLGIDKLRVWSALNIQGEDDLGIEELTTLVGLKTAIKDGEVSIDDAFPIGKTTVANPPAKKHPAQPVVPADDKATPAQGIANLCRGSGITEAELLVHLRAIEAVPSTVRLLEDVKPETLEDLKADWQAIVETVVGKRPAVDGPIVIPDDPNELLELVRDILARADLDEKDAVRCLVTTGKCGKAVKKLSEAGRKGLVWIVENTQVAVAWVNENAE